MSPGKVFIRTFLFCMVCNLNIEFHLLNGYEVSQAAQLSQLIKIRHYNMESVINKLF